MEMQARAQQQSQAFTSGNVAAATATATAPAVAGKTFKVTGIDVTGGGATAASVVDMTLTGINNGTLHFSIPVPAGATAGLTSDGRPIQFRPPDSIPASGQNQAVAAVLPSLGSGNTNATVTLYGYYE